MEQIKHGDVPVRLRLPRELKDWIRHMAIDAGRSMNAEVVHRLQQSRHQQEGKK